MKTNFVTVAFIAIYLLAKQYPSKKPNGGWNDTELTKYINSFSNDLVVIDPENILSEQAKHELTFIASSVKQLDMKLIIVSKISNLYWNFAKNKLDSQTFTQNVIKNSPLFKNKEGKSLLIVHSIIDEAEFWWLGKAAKKVLNNLVCSDIQKAVRKDLRALDIDASFIHLFESIKNVVEFNQLIDKIIEWIFVALVNLFLLVFLNRQRKAHLLNTRLKQLSNFAKSNINTEKFNKKYCALCLQKLYGKFSLASLEKVDSIIENIALGSYDYISPGKYADRPIIKEGCFPEDHLCVLSCDHSFHASCFDFYSKLYADCPVCFEGSASVAEDQKVKPFYEVLMSVQAKIWRKLLNPNEVSFFIEHERLPNPFDTLLGVNHISTDPKKLSCCLNNSSR